MVGVGLSDREQQLGGGRVGDVGIRGHGVALDSRVAVAVRVVHVEPTVARVAGVERHAQQPALATVSHPVREIEKWGREEASAANHADAPRLLDHEQPRIGARGGEVKGIAEPRGDGLEREPGSVWNRLGAGGRCRGQGQKQNEHDQGSAHGALRPRRGSCRRLARLDDPLGSHGASGVGLRCRGAVEGVLEP